MSYFNIIMCIVTVMMPLVGPGTYKNRVCSVFGMEMVRGNQAGFSLLCVVIYLRSG